MSQQCLTLFVISALALTLAGCDSGPNVAPVSGTVVLDGKPLAGANVNTQPIAHSGDVNPGSGSFGRTDAEGRYTLELVDPPRAGAIVGQHRVTIARGSKELYHSSDEPVRSRGAPWPTRYIDGSLRMTVPPEGTTEANFELDPK